MACYLPGQATRGAWSLGKAWGQPVWLLGLQAGPREVAYAISVGGLSKQEWEDAGAGQGAEYERPQSLSQRAHGEPQGVPFTQTQPLTGKGQGGQIRAGTGLPPSVLWTTVRVKPLSPQNHLTLWRVGLGATNLVDTGPSLFWGQHRGVDLPGHPASGLPSHLG